MSKRLLNLCLTALLSVVSTAAWALSEVNGVYQIGTAEDLKAFAELVNGDNPYANAVLTADIDKGTDGTMIGRDGQDYQGFFDGQGHTITINTFSSGADGTAIFRNVGYNALIQNLKVQGTITTDKKEACGIVAWNNGTIRGCYVDVNVVSAVAGDGTHAGIAGVCYQGAMIENCLAKFTIKGATTTNCGGIAGWCDGRTNIINCLVINDGSEFKVDGNSGTIGRNDGQLQTVNMETYQQDIYGKRPGGASTNNYATNAWGNTKCVTIVPYDQLADGRICYQLNNDQSHIAWTQEIGVDPFPVPAAFGGKQVFASAPTACDGKSEFELTFSNEGTAQATAHQYDKFGICQACGCFNIYALERDMKDGYYLLKSAEDIDIAEGWNRITNGARFSLKMANDITYQNEPGRFIFNTSNWFDGNFNGDGHELTIEMTDIEADNASLFPNFAGTFENVIMHGSITTSGRYAGSISSHTRRDRVKIRNVFSDIDINASYGGDNTSAGLIGVIESKTIVDNTIYAGNVNGTEATECLAGFSGWSSAQSYWNNCAFLGTLNNAIGDSKTFSRNPANITCSNVYFANEYDFEDEAKGIHIENQEDIENGALAYALNGNQGGVDRFYQKIGEDLFPYPIKKDGALVYAVASEYRCDGAPLGDVTYSNSPSSISLPPHDYVEGFCTVCDGMQEDFLTPVDGWFEIKNGAELVWWTNYAAKHLDASARLTDDIDMQGYCERWANVGTEGAPFYGNFDGQFHTISNLVVDHPNDNGVGLIAVMNSLPVKGYGGLTDEQARNSEGAYIKNVVLDESCELIGRGYVALVGMTAPWAGHVNIKGVMMCGDVRANGGPNAAGVFGCVMSSSCHVTIDNCGMVGNVYGPKENGSFSGWLGDWAEVTNCFAVGEVEGTESDARYFARYGNARVNDNIKNCYALHGTQEHVGIVTPEDFESGALAWKANGEQFRTGFWFQNIGEDMYPFPDPAHGTVIYAAEQYFSVANEDDLEEVGNAIKSYEEEAVEETIATQAVLDEYQDVLDALTETTTILEFADALQAVNDKKAEVAKNAEAYQTYITKCEDIKAQLDSDDSFEGELRDALQAYLTETDEPSEDNPLGTYEYIKETHTATLDQIKAETERVEEWLQKAIADGYKPGTDISKLISNSDFSNGENEKWTNGWATGMGKVADAEGKNVYGVEAWNKTGDMYQTLEDMKPGYYLVGTHAAFRPSNNRYSKNYAAGIYANGIFNYFPTIVEDYIAANDTIDQVNCNLHGSGAHDLAIYDDFFSTDESQAAENGATLLGYGTQGETGMAAAANAGRYQVYTIAVVGEDGQLTIGIKNPGTNYDRDWTGWSALKVVYCGEDAEKSGEALDLVLENMTARAQSIIEAESDEENVHSTPNFPAELRTALEELVASVDGADGVEAKTALAKKFSSLFEKIYEGKQAYVSLFNTANTLGSLEMGNLPLVEKDQDTGEWIETGEYVFSDIETEILYDFSTEMHEAYLTGAYTTKEAQNPAALSEPAVTQILPAKDEDGYYLLGNVKQLVAFRAISSFADYTVKAKLVKDIDMTGIGMQPINQSDYSFRGEFDGQGHSIDNVYIYYDSERCGFFNTLDGATVKNLKLTGDFYSGSKFMGGIAGYTYNAKIQNCDVNVTIHSAIAGDGTHGGVVGNNAGDGTLVENCIVRSTLLGEETNSCGGVIGWSGSLSEVRNTLILSEGHTIDTSNGCNTISRNDGNCTVSNVFYVATVGTANGTKVDAERLASGELTYLLNGNSSEDPVWFQTIGQDATPCLFNGGVVYFYGGKYINDVPNPQLNAFAYNVTAKEVGDNVVVNFDLNAEVESAQVNFYDGESQIYSTSVKDPVVGTNEVSIRSIRLGVSDVTKLKFEVAVVGKGTLDVLKVGESYSFNSPYGLAVNNNPASKGFGQILVTDSRPLEDREDMTSVGTPGALYAIGADYEYQGAFYGGIDVLAKEPITISGDYKFDFKDIRFTKDGRLFLCRASGTSNSSVYEINPENLEEPWKPVFKGGELDEATGITYVGEDEQNRMAVGLAVEGAGDDLKLYVLGAQRSNGEYNTTDYNCAIYNLGSATEWTAAPSAYFEPLDGVYTIVPGHVGIHEDGQGGLWYVQYRANPTELLPSIKHFDAEGNEDYSNTTTSTNSGKMAVTADGKYIALPQGSGKVVIYETNYVPMANGKIYLDPKYNISTTETNITGLAFDFAGNLYAASSASKTLSRYTIPSWNENKAVTPGTFAAAGTKGDLNGDGKVDIADAVTVLNIMAAGEYNASADINGDQKVDIADFVSILNIMAAQ